MTEDKKQELRQLLTEAMNEIVIKSVDGGQTMLIDVYRNELLLSRRVYRPNSDTDQRFYPDLRNDVTKPQLLDFIREELAPYIHEDKILSSSYFVSPEVSFGGFTFQDKIRVVDYLNIKFLDYYFANPENSDIVFSGYPLDRFLQQFLKIAILYGINAAVSDFDRCTKDTSGSFQIIRVLEGIKLKTEIQFEEGVRLIPIPNSVTEFPPCFLDKLVCRFAELTIDNFFGKTLLVIDASISPPFYDTQLTFDDVKKLIDKPPIYKKGESLALCNDNWFLKFDMILISSLALACRTLFQSSLQFNFLKEDTLFVLSRRRVGNVLYTPEAVRCTSVSYTSVEIAENHIDVWLHLYKRLGDLDSETFEKLKIPIDRWIMSITNRNPVDQMIDLGIAFEYLYLPKDNVEQLSFQLRLSAAWHLGKDKEDRKMLTDEFKAIYKLRSQAVHNGEISEKIKIRKGEEPTATSGFIPRAQDLCRQSIIKIIEDGKFPDWNDLILG